MEQETINKEKIINWIDKRINESDKFLKDNGTTYSDMMDDECIESYGENGDNNNFRTGIIYGLKELKEKFK